MLSLKHQQQSGGELGRLGDFLGDTDLSVIATGGYSACNHEDIGEPHKAAQEVRYIQAALRLFQPAYGFGSCVFSSFSLSPFCISRLANSRKEARLPLCCKCNGGGSRGWPAPLSECKRDDDVAVMQANLDQVIFRGHWCSSSMI